MADEELAVVAAELLFSRAAILRAAISSSSWIARSIDAAFEPSGLRSASSSPRVRASSSWTWAIFSAVVPSAASSFSAAVTRSWATSRLRSVSAAVRAASACACSCDTPGFSRTIDCIHPSPRRGRRSAPIICACIAIGTHADEATPMNEPMKPSGATPTMVIGTLLMVTCLPTTAGSPLKRRCQ